MRLPRFTIKRLMIINVLISILCYFAYDIYRHTVVERYPWVEYPIIWIDYGKVHCYIGGDRGSSILQFRILYWSCQEWSWNGPGHLRGPK